MLSLQSLSLNVNQVPILRPLSISFLPASIIYLFGANGSGKTSLLRALAGLNKSYSGKISTQGRHLHSLPKPYCTYIGHHQALKTSLTGYQHLEFWASSCNTHLLLEAAISYWRLTDKLLNQPIYQLSSGNQQRISLTRLLLCPSQLWLLDEVDQNLDAENQQLLQNLLITHANNNGICFFATHNKINQLTLKSAQILDLALYQC